MTDRQQQIVDQMVAQLTAACEAGDCEETDRLLELLEMMSADVREAVERLTA